jgi:hypothetical protein
MSSVTRSARVVERGLQVFATPIDITCGLG